MTFSDDNTQQNIGKRRRVTAIIQKRVQANNAIESARQAERDSRYEADVASQRAIRSQQIKQLSNELSASIIGALERLDHQGYPDGVLLSLPDTAGAMPAWELRDNSDRTGSIVQYLTIDGTICRKPSNDQNWTVQTPDNLLDMALRIVAGGQDPEGFDIERDYRFMIECCNLLCAEQAPTPPPKRRFGRRKAE
ncbi:MAG: hypothetical protein ABIR91_05270 [Candidatus Saccharimonadales bacterium]